MEKFKTGYDDLDDLDVDAEVALENADDLAMLTRVLIRVILKGVSELRELKNGMAQMIAWERSK